MFLPGFDELFAIESVPPNWDQRKEQRTLAAIQASVLYSLRNIRTDYLPTPPLDQDVTLGQFLLLA